MDAVLPSPPVPPLQLEGTEKKPPEARLSELVGKDENRQKFSKSLKNALEKENSARSLRLHPSAIQEEEPRSAEETSKEANPESGDVPIPMADPITTGSPLLMLQLVGCGELPSTKAAMAKVPMDSLGGAQKPPTTGVGSPQTPIINTPLLSLTTNAQTALPTSPLAVLEGTNTEAPTEAQCAGEITSPKPSNEGQTTNPKTVKSESLVALFTQQNGSVPLVDLTIQGVKPESSNVLDSAAKAERALVLPALTNGQTLPPTPLLPQAQSFLGVRISDTLPGGTLGESSKKSFLNATLVTDPPNEGEIKSTYSLPIVAPSATKQEQSFSGERESEEPEEAEGVRTEKPSTTHHAPETHEAKPFAESHRVALEKQHNPSETPLQTTPSERIQNMEQVKQQLEDLRLESGRAEIALQLKPEHLGNLRVVLNSTQEGVSARIFTENRMAHQAMESAKEQLRQVLENKGVSLVRFEVSLMQSGVGDGRQAFRQNSSSPRWRPTRGAKSGEGIEGEAVSVRPRLWTQETQLDYQA